MTSDWDPSTYGDRMADVYDEWYGPGPEVEQAAATLAALAGEGPALELGIGTGRLALALAARGLEVHGLAASNAMIERLRAKPGRDGIPATVAHLARVTV